MTCKPHTRESPYQSKSHRRKILAIPTKLFRLLGSHPKFHYCFATVIPLPRLRSPNAQLCMLAFESLRLFRSVLLITGCRRPGTLIKRCCQWQWQFCGTVTISIGSRFLFPGRCCCSFRMYRYLVPIIVLEFADNFTLLKPQTK